jgi:hypothetical protein
LEQVLTIFTETDWIMASLPLVALSAPPPILANDNVSMHCFPSQISAYQLGVCKCQVLHMLPTSIFYLSWIVTGPDIVINLKTQNFCLVVGFSNGILQLGICTKLPKLMLIPLIQLLYFWHCEWSISFVAFIVLLNAGMSFLCLMIKYFPDLLWG